jgi:uncharacterized protein involved in exopolysaccharide biosynthesis
MEERQQPEYAEDEISLGEYLAILRPHWWKILGLSLAAGVVTFLLLFLKPNLYKATAVITPAAEEKKAVPALGALASFGIEIGGATKVEDLEALFRSNDLTVRVFRKHDLWPVVFPKRYDPKSGRLKACWTDRMFRGAQDLKAPGDWDAIRAAEDGLNVFVNRKMGTLSVSFESPSPEGSANIVRHYLEEGKNRLQEEALDRATKNKKFIEEQIGKTVDALTRDRFYSLYGQEVEKEMLARNREQFGFRVIDSPRIPDRKSRPARAISASLVFFFIFLASAMYFLLMKKSPPSSRQTGPGEVR